jgi:hypothetical protein
MESGIGAGLGEVAAGGRLEAGAEAGAADDGAGGVTV